MNNEHWIPWPDSLRRLFWLGMNDVLDAGAVPLVLSGEAKRHLDTSNNPANDRYLDHMDTELQETRETYRSLRESTMNMFIGMLAALAFLAPVVLTSELAGPSWLHWALGGGAAVTGVYTGSLFGALLIDKRFRLPDASGIRSLPPTFAVSDLAERRLVDLSTTDSAVRKLRTGFYRMVRLAWLALVFWAAMAVLAGLN